MRKIRSFFSASTLTLIITITCVFTLIKCIDRVETDHDQTKINRFDSYTGSAKCATCHKNIYEKHIKTAHFLTSQIADKRNVMGSFEPGKNKFIYNPLLYIAMEKENGGLYQSAYYKGIKQKAERFDITIGSGVKGQSYMFWQGDHLFQLPITYFSFVDQWVNSPGYPNKVQFNRPITSRCMECHTTYAEVSANRSSEPEEYSHSRLILGVDCEKCHGAGLQHVNYQRQHPNENTGKYIINPASFSRQQSLDLCALCHGGRLNKTKPSFSFTSGDALSGYFDTDTSNTAVANNSMVDVHGNQYGLLKASKCFRSSEKMTCITCHNTHENERGNAILFSQRCMSCHNKEHNNFCTLKTDQKINLKNNCIDCHMPLQPSKAIVLFSSEESAPRAATFRTHLIAIYKEETSKFIRKSQ